MKKEDLKIIWPPWKIGNMRCQQEYNQRIQKLSNCHKDWHS